MRVVGAAIVSGATVLAARRKPPHRFAGGWEFPGGKVEAGESDAAALARECVEELGVDVAVGACLGVVADGGIELVLYAAELVRGEPAPLVDHDALRWLTAAELDDVDWLPVDRDLLPAVRAVLPH